MSRINILYLVSTLRRTGPTNQLSYIIKNLDRNEFNPIILTLSSELGKDSMKPYFAKNIDVRIETLGLTRIKGLFFAKRKVRQFIRLYNISIVHSQGIRADSIVSNLDVVKVATLRNYPFYDYPMKFGKIKGTLMARQHLTIIKKEPNKNIACSKTIAKEFEKDGLHLNYVQNGVDITKYFPLSQEAKRGLKLNLGIDLSKKIFISVGALISRKDMETVVKAFNNLIDYHSQLLILGDGPNRNALEKIANDRIYFLGNVSNVEEYLQASDCFVSASLAEGLPNSVLEAMACGLPTILSEIPSHLELYEGVEGNFFRSKDVSNLTKIFNQIAESFHQQKQVSLKQINNNFTAKMMSEKYQKIYQEKLNLS